MSDKNWNETWRTIVERSWADPQFRQDLLDNPNKVLTAEGLEVPPGVHFVVVENEPKRLHLVLPTRPGEQLSVSEAGGESLSQYNAAVVF